MSTSAASRSFPTLVQQFITALDSLRDRRLLLVGGKGGVGKTTISILAALHFARSRPVVLFSTDPASNLGDIEGLAGGEDENGARVPHPRENAGRVPHPPSDHVVCVETIHAETLYRKFLSTRLPFLVELGDRGTYLDREEIRKLFELAIPGADELMGWLRIGELVREDPERMVIVDTAPTGHTLRLFRASEHFAELESALATMQQKHRDLVEQLTRRSFRDEVDEFLSSFSEDLDADRAILTDATKTAFVPVTLAEPWVVEQTKRLTSEIASEQIDVPFVIVDNAAHDCDCEACDREVDAENALFFGKRIIRAPRFCIPFASAADFRDYLDGKNRRSGPVEREPRMQGTLAIPREAKLVFFAGKGGVGKTTCATSVALQCAIEAPQERFTIVSVDPAHTLRDVFAIAAPPPNLTVETIDSASLWRDFRDTVGREIEEAFAALMPANISLEHDEEVVRELLEIAPPGADELFAIDRLAELLDDETCRRVIVDTAPTGHFLRLLELPESAIEWVHELMRIVLHYRELIPSATIGQRLLKTSQMLRRFASALASPRTAVVVVTRPDPFVVRETSRLLASIESRSIRIAATIANAMTPPSRCGCSESRRNSELSSLALLGGEVVPIERKTSPPIAFPDLQRLVPMRQTDADA